MPWLGLGVSAMLEFFGKDWQRVYMALWPSECVSLDHLAPGMVKAGERRWHRSAMGMRGSVGPEVTIP